MEIQKDGLLSSPPFARNDVSFMKSYEVIKEFSAYLLSIQMQMGVFSTFMFYLRNPFLSLIYVEIRNKTCLLRTSFILTILFREFIFLETLHLNIHSLSWHLLFIPEDIFSIYCWIICCFCLSGKFGTGAVKWRESSQDYTKSSNKIYAENKN